MKFRKEPLSQSASLTYLIIFKVDTSWFYERVSVADPLETYAFCPTRLASLEGRKKLQWTNESRLLMSYNSSTVAEFPK